jgi:hypothetical protein
MAKYFLQRPLWFKRISYKNYTDMEGTLMNSFYGKPQGFLLSASSQTPLKYPLAYGSLPKVGIGGHNNEM